MAKETTENQQPALVILSQYIKDMSIEIPLAPEIFKEITGAPEVKVDINVSQRSFDEGAYEVLLNTSINAEMNGKKLFIIELSYGAAAGINVPEDALEQVLYIELPRLMFPFVRSIIANSLSAAGLPPIMLTPIDFVSLYQQRKAQQNETVATKKA
ncbi:MAG: protein-export chaperone SecB [Alphaproteobacteria bacterium]|nr:protein-export chaperone SecB [Alphaproteobacteria bacterium]